MKARTFKIESKKDIRLVSEFLEAQPDKPVLEVLIRKYHLDRSEKQNKG